MARKLRHRSRIRPVKSASGPLHLHITEVQLEILSHSDMNVVIILVGNKSNLKDAQKVPTSEGKALAEAQGLFFMETSALDSSNVAAAFQTVVKEIYNILSRKVMMSNESKKRDAPLDGTTLSHHRVST
ncbi:Ras-related protein Rab-11A [Hibiscus syriacus]|uniref:Ras-related protein Rab-11A n=1 Tax=Hibiscus syriacus TaxID=106335 RepID=A0A6A2Z4K3_HIBSY|nr:Ras-related protein Rab-11A [Hibiscus syriacus]